MIQARPSWTRAKLWQHLPTGHAVLIRPPSKKIWEKTHSSCVSRWLSHHHTQHYKHQIYGLFSLCQAILFSTSSVSRNSGVPSLCHLMPDNLRWRKVHSKYNALESSQSRPPTPVHGKTVFHKTSSWCQKGWRPLLSSSSVLTLSAWRWWAQTHKSDPSQYEVPVTSLRLQPLFLTDGL